jgi:hypothetical protein
MNDVDAIVSFGRLGARTPFENVWGLKLTLKLHNHIVEF